MAASAAPAPTPGQSTREVPARLLGIADKELDCFNAGRIIGTDPIPIQQCRPHSATLLRGQRVG
jgi:hypothetical protein